MLLHIIRADILLIARIFPRPKISARIICKTIDICITLPERKQQQEKIIFFWLSCTNGELSKRIREVLYIPLKKQS